MPKHLAVSQGQTLLAIAHAHGIFDWKRIWDDPANAALRALRPNPQVLAPGDKLVIPDTEPHEVTVPTGTRKFRLKRPPCFFTVFLKDEGGKPYASAKYKLVVGGVTFEGQTDSDGKVSHKVKADVVDGELTLVRDPNKPDDKFTWKVKVGALDPVETVSGLKGRLKNLGYDVGAVNDHLDDKTRSAIRDFRMHTGLDDTVDAIDDQVKNGLLKLQNLF